MFKLTGPASTVLNEAAAVELIGKGPVEDISTEEAAANNVAEESGPVPANFPIEMRDAEDWPPPSADFGLRATEADGTRAPASSGETLGRIIVGTTDWGVIQRISLSASIPATDVGMPNPAHVIIGYNPVTRQIGVNATLERDVANTVASSALQGIFLVHEKAAGWIFRLLNPFW